MPLAIELAAARVRVLSPQAMLPRLNESLSLLSGGSAICPSDSRRCAARWSGVSSCCCPEERVFFRRLGIFAGSFTEDAAAAVVGDAALDVLDGLTSLVEKNLLVRSEMRGQVRFHMLETVREFARERVAEAGEEREARLRHGEWVVQFLVGEHDNLLSTETRQAAHERIVSEETAARAALRFAAGPDGDDELAWQLFIRFGVPLVISYAQTAEVIETHELLDALPRSGDPLRAAQALGVWAWARASLFDSSAASDLEVACAVLEEAGDRDFLMCFQTAWGMVLAPSSLPQALDILERALMLSRAARQSVVEVYALLTICLAHLYGGDIDDAQRYADELATVGQRRHDEEVIPYALTVEARVMLMRGDLAGARTLFAHAAALAGARSVAWARAIALCGLASDARRRR